MTGLLALALRRRTVRHALAVATVKAALAVGATYIAAELVGRFIWNPFV